MNPWPVEAEVAEVHLPRPGHADLVGTWKYRLTDVRNVLERASARETAARVAGGALAKAFLRALGVEVRSHVVQIGSVRAPRARASRCASRTSTASTTIPVRCLDRRGEPRDGRAHQRPAQGERVARRRLRGPRLRRSCPAWARTSSWEERLDGRLAGALCSIQAVKGVAIGDAFDVAGLPGLARRTTRSSISEERGYYRETNHAGGLEGGMTTGEPLVVRGGDEAAADADQAAALGRHRHARARRRRCASAPTRAPSRRPASSARRWSPSCWPTPTARSSAATTSTTCREARRRGYEERIGWRAGQGARRR